MHKTRIFICYSLGNWVNQMTESFRIIDANCTITEMLLEKITTRPNQPRRTTLAYSSLTLHCVCDFCKTSLPHCKQKHQLQIADDGRCHGALINPYPFAIALPKYQSYGFFCRFCLTFNEIRWVLVISEVNWYELIPWPTSDTDFKREFRRRHAAVGWHLTCVRAYSLRRRTSFASRSLCDSFFCGTFV